MVSENSREDSWIRSRSRNRSTEATMSAEAGFNAGSSSSGVMYGHFGALSGAGGRPTPKLFDW